MAPGLGFLRPAADVGIVIAVDDGREGKAWLSVLGRSGGVPRTPVDQRNDAALPHSIVLRLLLAELLVDTGGAAALPGLTPMKNGNAFAGVGLKVVDGAGIPGGVLVPVLAAFNPGAPIDGGGGILLFHGRWCEIGGQRPACHWVLGRLVEYSGRLGVSRLDREREQQEREGARVQGRCEMA